MASDSTSRAILDRKCPFRIREVEKQSSSLEYYPLSELDYLSHKDN
jgi:hypothetical protein